MMRIAIVSDIHGNRTAFEAVLEDLQQTSPDLILHGGDLADAGASPVEIVDRIRDLGWPGVVGNTDELIFRPESLEEFAHQSSAPTSLWKAIHEMAATTRSMLGAERIDWLRGLSRVHIQDPIALVHASPESLWRAPAPEATDAELESIYGSLGRPIVVYGHIHRPYIRSFPSPPFPEGLIANTGSVGLPYDGDRRASYLLFDESGLTIRRVEYSVETEIKALSLCGLPHSDWIAKTLHAASPQVP
jgi:predicted phosphodiesterase